MKILYIYLYMRFFILALSFLILSCGENDRIISVTPPLPPIVEELKLKTGVYSVCDPLLNNPGFSYFRRFIIGENQITVEGWGYIGNGCVGTNWSFYRNIFMIDKITSLNQSYPAEFDADLRFIASDITIYHQPYLNFYATRNECGITNWTIAKKESFLGKKCDNLQRDRWDTNGGFVPNAGEFYYTRFKQETQDTIKEAEDSSYTKEGVTIGDRVDVFDSIENLRREP